MMASSVPVLVATLKNSPGSCQPSSGGMSTWWAVLEMGRYSVSPWIRAIQKACQ